MRIVAWVMLAIAGLILASAGLAQSREEMERCRALEDEARRLSCYDSIPLSRVTAPSKYERVSLDELKEFRLSYRGQLIEVTGWIAPGDDDLLFLGLDPADADTIPIDFAALPRHDRETFTETCGSGCDATVQGRVRPLNFTTGVVADALIVH
jgi:hypothetical protein